MRAEKREGLEPVRIAVLGTGSIGERHLRTLAAIDDVLPIAVPRRPERLSELSDRGFTVAASLEEAVAAGANLGIIATETGCHYQDGLQATGLGLDLLIEKPLATNAHDAKRLTVAARKARRQLYVACVLRFSESLNIARSLVGELGRLHSVRIECQSYFPDWQPNRPYQESFRSRAGEGGVLLDLIHEVDYAGWLFGWPESVQATVRNLGRLGINADEAAHLTWETPDGGTVSIAVDFLTRPSRRQMSVFGEYGTLVWDGIRSTVSLARADEPLRTTQSSATVDDMFMSQARSFANSKSGDADVLPVCGEDGVRALAICDAARKASESGSKQKVDYS